MSVIVSFQEEARRQLASGASKACRILRNTLGPMGRAVVIDREEEGPKILDNGAAAANEIGFRNIFENTGAQIIRLASDQNSTDFGDGTTTSAVLAESIFQEGLKLITAGVDPEKLRRGLQKGVKLISKELDNMSSNLDDPAQIEHIATLAAKGDSELGAFISEAIEEAGEHGVIHVEEGKATTTHLRSSTGLQIEEGYLSKEFQTDPESMECRFQNPYILLTDQHISDARKLLPIMKRVAREDRPLLVIAREVDRGALGTLVVNNQKGMVRSAAVKAPGRGDYRKRNLQDIATLTGGTPVLEELGTDISDISLDMLGEAMQVVISKDSTRITGAAGSEEQIRTLLEHLEQKLFEADSSYERERIQERKSRVAGTVVELYIGGASDTEIKEKHSRTKDGLNAAKTAMKTGIVPGGGISLIRAANALDSSSQFDGEEEYARKLLKNALAQPLRQIARNGGYDPDRVYQSVLEEDGDYGFDVQTGTFGKLSEFGIMDPLDIVKGSVQNAAGVAGLMFTTECLVVEKPDHGSGISPLHSLTAGML